MNIIRSKSFIADKAWDNLPIANMQGITTKLHWSDKPYIWHTNDGEEIFVVLDGKVQMFYMEDEQEKSTILEVGDIFYAQNGDRHKAVPLKESRMLVVEKEGSI